MIRRPLTSLRAIWIVSVLLFFISTTNADDRVELFEKSIRPLLVEHCYSCHNSTNKAEGNLKLDYRGGLLQGGDRGPSVVPGKPDESLLLQAIRHDSSDLKMPQGGPKLDQRTVAEVERWIRLGAHDPRDKPLSADELAKATSWETQLQTRKQWWSFQPVRAVEPPEVNDAVWSRSAVDRFIRAQLDEAKVEPSPVADPATLIRRVTFALTGLPPTAEEVEAFVSQCSPSKLAEGEHPYIALVDRLLASPRFGERFARHWMDWFRYAESHGSEGDPAIPHAPRYRDYLVRALNGDIAYNQLVLEHLAGDVISPLRFDQNTAVNESIMGLGHFRMVQHGYAPVDPLDDQVRFIENQIDVISKAFLGLTVACARCHDHKFDAISQRDFYALYGILASTRPAMCMALMPGPLRTVRRELIGYKQVHKLQLAKAWVRETSDSFATRLLNGELEITAEVVKAARADATHPLHAWLTCRDAKSFEMAWSDLRAAATARLATYERFRATKYHRQWKFSDAEHPDWHTHGNGLSRKGVAAGGFALNSEGPRRVEGIFPAGVFSHLLSKSHSAVLSSPRFTIDTDELWVRVAGGGGARVRPVIELYPRVGGPIYKGETLKTDTLKWVRWDMRFFTGDACHVEIATAADLPVEALDNRESWFGIAEVICRKKDEPEPMEPSASLLALIGNEAAPKSLDELARLYAETLNECVEAWQANSISDAQAEFLSFFVKNELLTNRREGSDVRRLNAAQTTAAGNALLRVPGIVDGDRIEQPLMIRGDHKKLGEPVPHRFLEAFDAKPYDKSINSRLLYARDIVEKNPLIARVLVNRMWHHLFGRGIVSTPDNFGRLGELPTHPELLDHLATEFVANGWSIKKLVRTLVLSHTFQLSSEASESAQATDPANLLWSHALVRRLEAEAIRDSLLAASGQLDLEPDALSVAGNSRFRSVYVGVRRNRLDPFLSVFDAPEPHMTRGSRDATNVPAQSLAMLNDPFVASQAKLLAHATSADVGNDRDRMINRMFGRTLGRKPTMDEVVECRAFVERLSQRQQLAVDEIAALRKQIEIEQTKLGKLLKSARERWTAKNDKSTTGKPSQPSTDTKDLPKPLARWEFDGDFNDSLGGLRGKAFGNAACDGGALVLDGSSYVATVPLAKPLTEKTLETWVQLDDLSQRGGGVMTVQTLHGVMFDSIVIGEQRQQQWLSGSNNFHRTKPFDGTLETEANQRPVHIAITYARDGRITGYRDGAPYGTSYQVDALHSFGVDNSQIVFGLRHSPAGGNKHLRGRIFRAQLYDRALSAEEIAASARAMPSGPTTEEILTSLEAQERQEYDRCLQAVKELQAAAGRLEQESSTGDPLQAYTDLALALFNLKEFIYVR